MNHSAVKSISTEELVRRIGEKDLSAFSAFYDIYSPTVYRFIFRRVNDKKLAERKLEEVFVDAWRTLSTRQVTASGIGGWIISLASKHCCIQNSTSQLHRGESSTNRTSTSGQYLFQFAINIFGSTIIFALV